MKPASQAEPVSTDVHDRYVGVAVDTLVAFQLIDAFFPRWVALLPKHRVSQSRASDDAPRPKLLARLPYSVNLGTLLLVSARSDVRSVLTWT